MYRCPFTAGPGSIFFLCFVLFCFVCLFFVLTNNNNNYFAKNTERTGTTLIYKYSRHVGRGAETHRRVCKIPFNTLHSRQDDGARSEKLSAGKH